MLKQLILLFLFFIATSFVSFEKSFLLDKEQFSILFPNKIEEESMNQKTAVGELVLKTYSYDATESENDSNLYYMAMSTEFPSESVNSDMTDKIDVFFKGSIEGAVNNVKGKLLSEKVIELNGFPGREIKVDFQDGYAVITMRSYLVKNKMYILQVITETEKKENLALDVFLNSFKLKTKNN